jgi:uncharacterized protein YkwD
MRTKDPTMTRSRTALTRTALVAVLLTGLTTLAAAPAGATTLTPRMRMLRATNSSRVTYGIRRVDIHWEISKLAKQHSIAMANKGSIFHSTTSTIQNSYLKGINWSTWGENVGVTGGSIADLQKAFMGSYYHRLNILNQRFKRVAVGTYRDDAGLLWVTVFFYG